MVIKSEKSIQGASLWNSLKSSLSLISQTLAKSLSEITKYGLEVKPIKIDKNHIEYIIDCRDVGEVHAWADRETEKDEDGNVLPYKMKMEFEGAKKDLGTHALEDMHNLVAKEFQALTGLNFDKVREQVEKEKKNANASTSLKAGFHKITCGDESTVNLTSVICDYAPSDALVAIDSILNDDEFIENLPEDEEVTFEIQDDGETDYIIDEIAELDISSVDCYEHCRVCATKLVDILQTIHVNAKGKQFSRLHSQAEGMLYDVRYQIDTLTEWSVQHFGWAKSCNEISQMYEFHANMNGYTLDEALPIMRQAINEYIDCLTLFYCNMSNVAKTTVDNWLEGLDKTANYILARTELE